MKKLKQIVKKSVVFLCVMLVAASILAVGTIKLGVWLDNLMPSYIAPSVNVPRKPLSIKDYVLNEVKKAGLDVKIVDCIISKESRWDNWAYNINDNGTTDFGLFQINSIHKGSISVAERFNIASSTKWAINKMKKDGYGAWTTYNQCRK